MSIFPFTTIDCIHYSSWHGISLNGFVVHTLVSTFILAQQFYLPIKNVQTTLKNFSYPRRKPFENF